MHCADLKIHFSGPDIGVFSGLRLRSVAQCRTIDIRVHLDGSVRVYLVSCLFLNMKVDAEELYK